MGKACWGWLFAVAADVPSLNLTEEKVSVGRDEDCDLLVSADRFPAVSKCHFTLARTPRGAQITDRSTNGTFVDGRKVGRGRTMPLPHSSTISIGGALHKHKAFVYMDKGTCDSSNYIKEIRDKYAVATRLGEGGFGEVFLVFNKKTHERFAMKVIESSRFAKREAKILKELKHPCVIQTCQIFINTRELFFVLELMEGGDLSRWVNHSKLLSERQSKLIFYQLVIAVEYLHKNGIAHRDLKPANILLVSQEPETLIKVTDFGLSKNENQDSTMNTTAGTDLYLAPEVMSNKPYTKLVDLWSMGVILFYSLSGTPPFINIREAMHVNFQIMFATDRWMGVSASALELVKRMLVVTPDRRISIQEMLASSWLQDESVQTQAHALMGLTITEEVTSSTEVKPQSHTPGQRQLAQPRGVLQYVNHQGVRALGALQYKPDEGNRLGNPRQPVATNQHKIKQTNKLGQVNQPAAVQPIKREELNNPVAGVNQNKPDHANRLGQQIPPRADANPFKLDEAKRLEPLNRPREAFNQQRAAQGNKFGQLNQPRAAANQYRADQDNRLGQLHQPRVAQGNKFGQLNQPRAGVDQYRADQDNRLGLLNQPRAGFNQQRGAEGNRPVPINQLALNQPKLEQVKHNQFEVVNRKPQPGKNEDLAKPTAMEYRPGMLHHRAQKTFLLEARNQLKPAGFRNTK